MKLRARNMNRKQRLRTAPAWIAAYTGGDIIRSYRKHYSVDRLCALIELKQCGQPITDEQIETTRTQLVQTEKRKLERKALLELGRALDDQNDTFAYIAGYTSWGFPYGVTWEEMAESEDEVVPPWTGPSHGGATDDPFDDLDDPFGDAEAIRAALEDPRDRWRRRSVRRKERKG